MMTFKTLTFALMVFLISFGSVFAQDTLPILEVDFSDGEIPEEIGFTEGWELVSVDIDGEETTILRGVANDEEFEETLFIGYDDWTNYVVDFNVRFSGDDYFGIGVRTLPDDEACVGGYWVGYSGVDDYFDLATVDADCDVLIMDEATTDDFPLDEWVMLSVTVQDSVISASLDGEEILLFDDSTYAMGSIMLSIYNMSADVASITVTGDEPITLSNANGEPADVIAELQELGLVPDGGSLLFTEDHAWFTGSGDWFTPLASASKNTNIVMAGELTFNSGTADDFESCGLMSRVQSTGDISTGYLEISLINDGGSFAYFDFDDSGTEIIDGRVLDLDFTQSYHVLIVAVDNKLTVFLDGKSIFFDHEISERDGYFGIGLTGRDANTRCDGRDIWVYQFD